MEQEEETVEEWVRRTREESGVPPRVADPGVLGWIAKIIRNTDD